MPQYNVSISFSLRTMIEPEGDRFDRSYPEGVEDISDESYFRNCEIDADGGNVTFTVTAESEETPRGSPRRSSTTAGGRGRHRPYLAGRRPQRRGREGHRSDDHGVRRRSVQKFIAEMEGMDDDLREAFGFLLDLTVSQEQRIVELSLHEPSASGRDRPAPQRAGRQRSCRSLTAARRAGLRALYGAVSATDRKERP